MKGNDPCDQKVKSQFILSSERFPLVFCCACFVYLWSLFSRTVLPFSHSKSLYGVCGNACHSSRSTRGNAHPVMPRLAPRGRRSALNGQIRTPQWALDLWRYFRQQDLIELRIALRALRWLTSAILEAIREREQRTELDLIEGNV